MKKMLTALCAAVMAACAMAAPAFAEGQSRDVMIPESERAYFNAVPVYALGDDLSLYEKGDVNLDGEVDVKDANLIITEYNLYTLLNYAHLLDENQRQFANLEDRPEKNGDKITSLDANVVLRYRNYRLVGNDVTMDEFLEIWMNNREATMKVSQEAVDEINEFMKNNREAAMEAAREAAKLGNENAS